MVCIRRISCIGTFDCEIYFVVCRGILGNLREAGQEEWREGLEGLEGLEGRTMARVDDTAKDLLAHLRKRAIPGRGSKKEAEVPE